MKKICIFRSDHHVDNIEDALTNLAGHLPFGGAPATEETTTSPNLSADIVAQDVVTSRNVFEAVSVTSTVIPPITTTDAADPVSTTRLVIKTIDSTSLPSNL